MFITNRGLYKPNVMFFGLQNSPATFQAMMDDYFGDLIQEGWIVIYMDDILVHVQTKEELESQTKKVLEHLQKYNLYLKLEKCKFAIEEVEFLGMIITENTIKMDPIKLARIRDWPTPTAVKHKQIRSFLGFGNFYQRFISGFAHLTPVLKMPDTTKLSFSKQMHQNGRWEPFLCKKMKTETCTHVVPISRISENRAKLADLYYDTW